MHGRGVHTATPKRAKGGPRRSGDGKQAPRSESVEHRLSHTKRRIAPREYHASGYRARKQSQPPVVNHAVRPRPARSGYAPIGELGSHELTGNAPHADRLSVTQAVTERGDDLARTGREQFLDARRQGPCQAERGIHGRHVMARLDRCDELSAHPGASRELGLG